VSPERQPKSATPTNAAITRDCQSQLRSKNRSKTKLPTNSNLVMWNCRPFLAILRTSVLSLQEN